MSAKQKNQHIKVFARVRPRNSQELRSQVVVECLNSKEISVKDKGQVKNFAFDRVFGPESKQVDVYKAVVAPLISEVLQGYNCTVFAYGQTGTGKTFTMVGDKSKGDNNGGWQNDPLSGIVPRTLDHLFDELKVRAEEFTVRISFLELYNEELCDLLAPPDNDDTKTLRLFEDSMKKGSVIVSGLEERTVYEKNDVYPILEAGSLRRQTAPTLMNASSSRSHTIFTITVHVKVTTPEGEDLFKTGKLNLVDLAGSENIGRSGAVDMRAREAGNINQSLLTLGRVITSLVERTPHVPYRESKLTRILQDSLGGRTKTSIIATVSPALCNLEETLSTFDYAHRARNITNKPEINQKMSKHVLLKNYTDEIERLRRDLVAAREKHGVYLLSEDYNSMISQIENLNKDLVNKIQILKVREDDLIKQEEIMQSLNMDLHEVKSDLAKNVEILEIKQKAIEERECALQELSNQAQVLLQTADEATEDSKRLHDRLDRAKMVHTHNEELVDRFKSRFINNLQSMKHSTQAFQSRGAEMAEELINLNALRVAGCRENQTELDATYNAFIACLSALFPNLSSALTQQIERSSASFKKTTDEVGTVGTNLEELFSIISNCMKDSQASRDPAWSNLASLLAQNAESNKQMAKTLDETHGCADKCAGILKSLPEQLQHKVQKEEQVLAQLKGKDQQLQAELIAISDELEVLMKRERAAWEAKREVDAELARQEKRVREAQQQAATAVANDALATIITLLENLTDLTKLNVAISNSAEHSILPVVNNLRTSEWQERERMSEQLSVNLKQSRENCEELVIRQRAEIEALDAALVVGRQALDDATAAIESFKSSSQQVFEKEDRRLTDCDQTTLSAYRNLANEISAFCDQSFANIHDRTTELKVHLKEEYRKDEKTGNTPQRKEFHYPKKLITTGKFNDTKENVPPPTSLSQSQNEMSE